MTTPNPDSTATEIDVITDLVDRQRARVASLAEPFIGTERDDVMSAIYEAERQLMVAVRALRRAGRTLDHTKR